MIKYKYLMPPKKKTKVGGNNADKKAAVAVHQVHQLEDILANILGWLRVEEIMCSRRVCKKWKEAVKKTIVPPCHFYIYNVKRYNAMRMMTEAMPNLQQITIGVLGDRHKYSNGEDPNRLVFAAWTGGADYTTHDIGIISNFTKLRTLEIHGDERGLNGRYPVLFNFPLLQKLSISRCYYLKWDLEMLAGLPSLKELYCWGNPLLAGNISSLRVLKDTLEKVTVTNTPRVEGNFMNLADFPYLKELHLLGTAITGDIRDIGENDFSTLEELKLPKGVYGADGYELEDISDAPDLVRAVHLFNKQRPALKIMEYWAASLSRHSPDWYDSADEDDNYFPPPFYIRFAKAGSRVGFRWITNRGNESCEVNWLDPQPDRESSDYEEYIVQLEKIQDEIRMYRGFHQPPTEEEYHRLVEG